MIQTPLSAIFPRNAGCRKLPGKPEKPSPPARRPHPLERGVVLLPAILGCIALLLWSAWEFQKMTGPAPEFSVRAAAPVPGIPAVAGYRITLAAQYPVQPGYIPRVAFLAPALQIPGLAAPDSSPAKDLDPAWAPLLDR
ncbi:MAG: hypothetical protein LBJ82_04290, partial [Deltaproteobacteria bacterium]|nr:hypothetical protein [Deltaproteobacteria bacterium]